MQYKQSEHESYEEVGSAPALPAAHGYADSEILHHKHVGVLLRLVDCNVVTVGRGVSHTHPWPGALPHATAFAPHVHRLSPEGRFWCAAECAVRFEPVCANTGFFATFEKCFRAG
jgi:hypothetical protein